MPVQLAFEDVKGGMNAADPPHKIEPNQVARMVNCQLVNQMPTTRPPVRVVPLSGTAAEFAATGNVQGAIYYNPAAGQGGIRLAAQNPSIATAIAGRKFLVKIAGRRQSTRAELVDITGEAETDRMLHLVYWSAWEDRLIATNGQDSTFIWDGVAARFSPGYDTTNRGLSRIPNGAGPVAYAHARGIVVTNSRFILASDSLHQTDFSTSANLENFIDQTYAFTGQMFTPPTALGPINAIANLPIRNTQHGHGETFFHCANGYFSIDFNVFPRSAWSSTPMVKTAFGECGATGPYAVAVFDGDQIFRTRKGVQSLRSAAANTQLEGQPDIMIGQEVNTWLSADYPRWHRFAVVEKWPTQNRVFVTTGPIVSGRFRWNRGILAKNLDPAVTKRGSLSVWEGLWTLPPQMAGIIHPVTGLFADEERIFAWVRGEDGRNRLVEFDPTLTNDVLEDGTEMPIEAQVITRAVDAGKWWQSRQYTKGRLYLRDIAGTITWGVWYRSLEDPTWKPWRAGTATNPEPDDELAEAIQRPLMIPLSDVPNACGSNESRGMQFLIRWRGRCTLQGLTIEISADDRQNDDLSPAKLAYTFTPITETGYDDFAYSTQMENPWQP